MAEYLAEDLSAEVQAKMDELAQKGNQLEKQGRFTEAVQAWQAGLALIPEPQQFYGQTVFGGDWRRLFSAGRICAGARML